MEFNIKQGDCLELMKGIPDGSVDMILADLPYGTTALSWDEVIPFEPLWAQYERIIKDNGAIVLFGSEPFSSYLRMSNIEWYRYDWIWEKTIASNFMLSKRQPHKKHENVLVFYKRQPTYNPQMEVGKPYKDRARKRIVSVHGGQETTKKPINNKGARYPSSVQLFSNGNNHNIHPTQKPVALLEYFIKTYTNEGETVLDNCAGSFTTAVACDNTNRNWICMEKEEKYCNIGLTRINDNRERLSLPLLDSIN